MRFSTVATVAGLAAGATASYNVTEPPVYTTEVVTAYTTYCPGPTTISHGSETYTVTEATTLTITNCPCTVTYPVTSAPPVPTTYAPPASSYVPPPVVTPPPYPSASYTPPAPAPSSPAPYPSVSPPPNNNGGNRVVAASGAGLAAILGFAAYVL